MEQPSPTIRRKGKKKKSRKKEHKKERKKERKHWEACSHETLMYQVFLLKKRDAKIFFKIRFYS